MLYIYGMTKRISREESHSIPTLKMPPDHPGPGVNPSGETTLRPGAEAARLAGTRLDEDPAPGLARARDPSQCQPWQRNHQG